MGTIGTSIAFLVVIVGLVAFVSTRSKRRVADTVTVIVTDRG